MRSDWQDAPQRVRASKRPQRWCVWLGWWAMLAIVWALLMSYGKTWTIDLNALQQVVQRVNSVKPPPLPEFAAPPPITAEPAIDAVLSQGDEAVAGAELQWQVAPPIRSGQALRNDFNDTNYLPRAPHNTYAPPSYPASTSSLPERSMRTAREPPERTVVGIKSWGGGTEYLAQWYSLNNYIDGGTVCGNHRKGSIEYRECRKGAKQYFHEQCRKWRARYLEDRADTSERMRQRYCSASSSFNPMG